MSQAGITDIQNCNDPTLYIGNINTSDSCTFTLNNGTTSGNTVIVFCQFGGVNDVNPTVTVTDDKSNSYTEVPNTHQYYNGDAQGGSIFYASNVAAGAKTIKCNYSPNANYISIIAHEYSGLVASNVVDTSAGSGGGSPGLQTGSGTNNASVGPMSTTVDGDFIYVGYIDTQNYYTPTAGTNSLNYNIITNLASSAAQVDEYAIQTTHGSVTGSITDNTSGHYYTMSMVAFKTRYPTPTWNIGGTVATGGTVKF